MMSGSSANEQAVEMRNLRHLSGRDLPDEVTFGDISREHVLTFTREEYERLGEPTYIVVSVRGETFAEATA